MKSFGNGNYRISDRNPYTLCPLISFTQKMMTNPKIEEFLKKWTQPEKYEKLLKQHKQMKMTLKKLKTNDQINSGHPIPKGFSSFLLKPYIKAVTQFSEVEWWRTLMVECETIFWLFDPTSNFTLLMGLSLKIRDPCIIIIWFILHQPLNSILGIQMAWAFHLNLEKL